MINITVIGFGNVGAALLLLLLNNARAIRLNVMEPDDQRKGAFLDLAHSMFLYLNKELIVNDQDLLNDSDFIFYTAGKPNVHGRSRLSTAKQNIQLAKELFDVLDLERARLEWVLFDAVGPLSSHSRIIIYAAARG